MAQWVKNLPTMRDTGDAGSVLGSGRFPRGGNDNPLQYSCLKSPMDRVHEQELDRIECLNRPKKEKKKTESVKGGRKYKNEPR